MCARLFISWHTQQTHSHHCHHHLYPSMNYYHHFLPGLEVGHCGPVHHTSSSLVSLKPYRHFSSGMSQSQYESQCMSARLWLHLLEDLRDPYVICMWEGNPRGCRWIEQGLTSHQTHYRSYRGRVFTGQMTQPTVSKHWMSLIQLLNMHDTSV